MTKPRVLFLNRSYWPDTEATGQLLTELCEDLADSFDVHVLAGRPNHIADQTTHRSLGTAVHNGVTIHRVLHTRFPKRILVGKAINLLTFLAAASFKSLRVPRPDIVVTETDPFLLPAIGKWIQRLRGCRHVVYLQDIYPDIAVALEKVREGWLTRFIRNTLLSAYHKADQIVVLSRDMKELLVGHGIPAEKIVCIPNWVDTESVYPIKDENAFRESQNLDGKFVVMHSGNMGLSQKLENVLEAAALLQEQKRTDIEFLMVGGGASQKRLEQYASDRQLQNVRFLAYQPKSELAQSLSAADVHLISVDRDAIRCLMPSKLYGILASGTPVIAIAPDDCELSEIIEANEVGTVAAPDDSESLANQIQRLAAQPRECADMSARARHLAETEYDRRIAVGMYREMLERILAPAQPAPVEPKVAQPIA